MMRPDSFGPWADGISDRERAARWRAMAALSLVHIGGRHGLLRCCIAAEVGADDAAVLAWAALLSLEPLPRRRLLSAYCALDSLITELRREVVR
jgi:hypothetical protein